MIFKRFNEIRHEYGLFFAFTRSAHKIYYTYYNYLLSKKFHTKGLNIHPSANLIGLANMQIGLNFFAGKHLRLEAVLEHRGHKYNPQIIIGNNVSVVDFVHIGATNRVEIGDNVLMGSHIYISDHNHGVYRGKNQTDPHVPPIQRHVSNDQKVIVGENVWIGELVSILPGVTIGQGSIIGANSVVAKDIPPFSLAVGAPAKVTKEFNFDKQVWTIL
jgi:acetyltransferase-like isoleucine patch superfamily enzyme